MKKKIFSVLKYIFFLAVGIVLFWLAFRGEDMNKVLLEFKHADYRWIALAVVVMIGSHIVRSWRWNQLLATLGIKTKTHTTFYAVMIGYFVNNAVPRLGEITRCGVLARHHKAPVNSVIGTVVAERAFDVLVMFVILIVTILAQLSFLSAFLYEKILDPITARFSNSASAFAVIGGVLIGGTVLLIILYRLMLPRLRKMKVFHKVLDMIKGFWQGIKTIKNVKNKGLFVFNSLLMWGLYALTTYVCFFALETTQHLTFIDALTVMALGSIGTLAPTPGGIGAYQYFVKVTLSGLFLVPVTAAFSFANIVYFSQWFTINIIGGISWIILFLSDKKKSKL